MSKPLQVGDRFVVAVKGGYPAGSGYLYIYQDLNQDGTKFILIPDRLSQDYGDGDVVIVELLKPGQSLDPDSDYQHSQWKIVEEDEQSK